MGDDDAAAVGEVEVEEHGVGGVGVEPVGWFLEQEDGGFGEQGASEEQAARWPPVLPSSPSRR